MLRSVLGFGLALGVLGCGDGAAGGGVNATAHHPTVVRAGELGGPAITSHFPAFTGQIGTSQGSLVPAANNAFCGTAPCDSNTFNRFPIVYDGQRLDLAALIEVSPVPDTVEVRLYSGLSGAPVATVLNPTSTTAVACDDVSGLCTDGLLDLNLVGSGLREIQVDATQAGLTTSRSFPLAVATLQDALEIAYIWVEAVGAADPGGIGLEVTTPMETIEFAYAVFESNPIATFTLIDDAIAELSEIANGDFFTTDLDLPMEMLARSRFFTGRQLLATTLAERDPGAEWQLLSGNFFVGPNFPFDNQHTFRVDVPTLYANVSDALDGLDALAAALAVQDMDNADDLAAIDVSGVAGFTADATITGAYASGDEDWYELVNDTASTISVRATTSGTCSTSVADTQLTLRNRNGAVLSTNDNGGGALCSLLDITLLPGSIAFVGVLDHLDDTATARTYTLSLDFGINGNVAVSQAESEPNDDGAVSLSSPSSNNGNDFALSLFDAVGRNTQIATRDIQIVGDGVDLGTVGTLLDGDADAVPTLQGASMLDGDDIMAALVGRDTQVLSTDPTRERRIFLNDDDAGPGEPAYGRYVLASVADSLNETLFNSAAYLDFATFFHLLAALDALQTVATAMDEFPEGYNTSSVETGEIGANERLITEVYLAAQTALEELAYVQSSAIDTSSWRSGIAVGLNSVARFSAFTGSRPMSLFRDDTDAAASFECRYGKALLNLVDGDTDETLGIFQRSKCQLIDLYNEHYATGSVPDPLRIPDDGCIFPSDYDCPVGGSFDNSCPAVSQGGLADALDPGWTPSDPANCGTGDPYNPTPVTLPFDDDLDLLGNDLVPQPYCYSFTTTSEATINVSTSGDCELGDDDTEITLFSDSVSQGPVNTVNSPLSNKCDSLSASEMPAGDYTVCIGNRLTSAISATSQVSISLTNDYLQFSGVQANVPIASLNGWTQCYMDNYGNSVSLATVLTLCGGADLMLACRPVGGATLSLAAQAPRADVLFDTGTDTTTTHTANGVAWYFSNTRSWGFAPAGETVGKNTCDIDVASQAGSRLCFHTSGGTMTGGFRCGNNQFLNGGVTAFERVIYTHGAGLF